MSSLFSILLKVNVILVIYYGLFLLLSKRVSIRAQRITLLLLPLLSFITFYLSMLSFFTPLSGEISTVLTEFVVSIQGGLEPKGDLISSTYILGFVLFTLLLIFRLLRTRSMFKSTKVVERDWYTLHQSPKPQSFSFFRDIHLNENLEGEERDIVLEHELLHVRYHHTYDILFFELFHLFSWFNPILFLMKSKLSEVHEKEVDAEMYKTHKNNYLNTLLSQSFGGQLNSIFISSQFHKEFTLAKRIKTMKNKTTFNNRNLLVLPLIMLLFVAGSWTVQANRLSTQIPEELQNDYAQPEFKGGKQAMVKYLMANLKYPEAAKKDRLTGRVLVQFFVDKDGSIKDAKVVQSVHPILDAEALRVVAGMPDWTPAKQSSKAVKAKMILPIVFEYPE